MTFGSGGRSEASSRDHPTRHRPGSIGLFTTRGNRRRPETVTACRTAVTPERGPAYSSFKAKRTVGDLQLLSSARALEDRPPATTGMPEGKDFDAIEVLIDAVVEVVADPRQVKATDTCQGCVPGCGAHSRLGSDKRRCSLEFFGDRVWCLRPVESPPLFSGEDLRLGDVGNDDGALSPHPRRRRSARRSAIGVVWPFWHCSMAVSKTRLVSASTANVSSPSVANTATVAPSGSSPSNSTRPPTTRPGAILIEAILAPLAPEATRFVGPARSGEEIWLLLAGYPGATSPVIRTSGGWS